MIGMKQFAARRYYVWLGGLALLLLLGLAAWIYELVYGLATTGMRGVISWGLYICTFAFFVKLSAGGLIVASSAEVFGIEALKPLSRLGALTAAVCITIAALAIIPDLGQADRIQYLVLHPNWRSPMIWDVLIVAIYLALALTELRLMFRKVSTEDNQRRLRILACVGLPAAFALHSITAWIFGLQVSHRFWNTALMAPLFVVSAVLSGTALIAIIAWCLQKFAGAELQDSTWRKLSGLMAVSLAIDLFFVFSEYLTIGWAGVPNEMVTLRMILPGGQFAILFWLEWLVGGMIPFLLLVMPRTQRLVNAIAVGALLILVGVYAFQIELTTVGMANPLIPLAPGVSLGTFTTGTPVFQIVGHYVPTWVEYLIVAALIALAAMLVTLGIRYLGFSELSLKRPGHSQGAQKAAQA